MVSKSWPPDNERNCSNCQLDFGIAEDRLLRPYFLSPHLTGAIYNDFLRKVLPEPLQDMNLQTRIQLWFMHDNVPPHFLLAVWEFLNMLLEQLIA